MHSTTPAIVGEQGWTRTSKAEASVLQTAAASSYGTTCPRRSWCARRDLNPQNVLPLKQADMPFSYARVDGPSGGSRTRTRALLRRAALPFATDGWCDRKDSNLHGCCQPAGFKPAASTSSATIALWRRVRDSNPQPCLPVTVFETARPAYSPTLRVRTSSATGRDCLLLRGK